MKRILCFVLSLWLGGLAAHGEDFSGKSPSGKIAFGSKNEKQFYVWTVENPNRRMLVYDEKAVFIQSAAISPDDIWIALEQGGASLGHTILFFKREKGLIFKRVGEAAHAPDPADKVGAAAMLAQGFKENILDHSYLHPVEWTADSRWLIVALDGKGSAHGQHVRVTNWRCRYNPVTAEVQPLKDNPGKIEVTTGQ